MSRPLLDWSDPHKTPREPQQGSASREDAARPPVVSSRPLSFASVGGDVIWQTYPGHLFLTVEQAEAVLALVAEEWTRARMSGGGPCGAVSMADELNTAINAARRWRQAQGAA